MRSARTRCFPHAGLVAGNVRVTGDGRVAGELIDDHALQSSDSPCAFLRHIDNCNLRIGNAILFRLAGKGPGNPVEKEDTLLLDLLGVKYPYTRRVVGVYR